MNSDFDDVEEAVSNAMMEAKRNMNDPDNDRERFLFFKGRWSAFKEVLEIMSNYGQKG